MKKIYQIPATEVNEVLPIMLLAGSGEITTIDGDGDDNNDDDDTGISGGGGGDGTPEHGGAPRSNGSHLWDY